MVLNQRFLPDIRVEKEIKVLKVNGYRVIVVASEEGLDSGDYEIIRIGNLRKLINRIFTACFFCSPFYLKKLTRKLRENNIDLEDLDYIHVHDLIWARTGYKISKRVNAKFILDLHENMPAALQNNYSPQLHSRNVLVRLIFNIVLGRKRWKKYELDSVRKADRVIVVVEEAMDRFPKEYKDKFTIVSNTEEPNNWAPKSKKRINEEFIVLYIGGVYYHRGVDILIESYKYLVKDYPYIRLKIIGLKNDLYAGYLNKLVVENNLQNHVKLINWVPYNEVEENIIDSDLCAVPHNNIEHTQTTIPHKLFQYMAMSKPVLVSDVKPLKRVVKETKSGFIFKAGNAIDCAEKIKEAIESNDLEEYGKKGRKATEEIYNWNHDVKRLLSIYKQLSI